MSDALELTSEEAQLVMLALLDASIGWSRREIFYGPQGDYPDERRQRDATFNKLECRRLANLLIPYAARFTATGTEPAQKSAHLAMTPRRSSKRSSRA